jgi:hypothetical protein
VPALDTGSAALIVFAFLANRNLEERLSRSRSLNEQLATLAPGRDEAAGSNLGRGYS